MIIKAFPSGPVETNAYIIACERTKQAAIVDPSPDCFHIIVAYLEAHQLLPVKILITHSHWDHIADVSRFKQKYSIPLYIHSLDAANLQNPGADGLRCWVPIEGVSPDHLLEEGESFSIGDIEFLVMHTPGHSPGGACFYSEKNAVLISGDTLFQGAMGRLDLPTAQPELMWASLKKLAKLPSNVTVYPGHGPKTTIGQEAWLSKPDKKF